MPQSQFLVLTTDFGLQDPYVGVMKGVAQGINPNVRIIDLTHQIRPQNVAQASFVLGSSYRFFPPGAIHVVVVDPGVGTDRHAVLLLTPHGRFLAPDNGVLGHVFLNYLEYPPEQAGEVDVPAVIAAYRLTNPQYWLHPVSRTFHGRDVFAPAAAHLSLGVPPDDLGEPVKRLSWLPTPLPARRGNLIHGQVINVDHFGNLVTNIPAAMLEGSSGVDLKIRGRIIHGLSPTFHGGPEVPQRRPGRPGGQPRIPGGGSPRRQRRPALERRPRRAGGG